MIRTRLGVYTSLCKYTFYY